MQDNVDTLPIARGIFLAILIGSAFWCLVGFGMFLVQ
jgi:hypothetical protein